MTGDGKKPLPIPEDEQKKNKQTNKKQYFVLRFFFFVDINHPISPSSLPIGWTKGGREPGVNKVQWD